MPDTIKAHTKDWRAQQSAIVWRPAMPPKPPELGSGRLRSCSWCGSMHPADLASAIRDGATLSWADRKYGWPHKSYVDGVPNVWEGLPHITSGAFCGSPPKAEIEAGLWEKYQTGFDAHTGNPLFSYRQLPPMTSVLAKTHGKFYTEHLQDAEPANRELIERAMGLTFVFGADGSVTWKPVPA